MGKARLHIHRSCFRRLSITSLFILLAPHAALCFSTGSTRIFAGNLSYLNCWVDSAERAISLPRWPAWSLERSEVLILLFLLLAETALLGFFVERRKKATGILERRVAIEKTISACSANLATCSADQVDDEIRSCLHAVLQVEHVDRALWFVIGDEGSAVRDIVTAHRIGVTAEPLFYSCSDLPWVTRTVLGGRSVILSTLDDLPPEAHSDRLYFEKRSIRSVALIPSSSGHGSRGVLVLVSLFNRRTWHGSLVDRLGVLGDIFASALVRKYAQTALEDSESRFRSLVTEAPIGIALEDATGRILFANPALCSMLGYGIDEMVGMSCTEFADSKDEEEDWKQFQNLQAGMVRSYQLEKRYRRTDGQLVWGRLNVSLLKSREGLPLILATVEDITQRKVVLDELNQTHVELRLLTSRLLERQEEERRRIARELHDDIGQRLTMLKMEFDAMRDDARIDKTDEHGRLSLLANQIEELVVDVHNMSHQLHSSKLKYLGLEVALKELCRQFSCTHQVQVNLAADRSCPALPENVSLCLYRVAQEALNNAVRHSTSPRIEVKLTNGGSNLRLHVKDFGVGFDPVACQKGLGMVAMQERLKMIDGRLRVSSSMGRGTEVVAEVALDTPATSEKVA